MFSAVVSAGIIATVVYHTVAASPAFHDQKKYAPTTRAAARPRNSTLAPAFFPPAMIVCASQKAP